MFRNCKHGRKTIVTILIMRDFLYIYIYIHEYRSQDIIIDDVVESSCGCCGFVGNTNDFQSSVRKKCLWTQ